MGDLEKVTEIVLDMTIFNKPVIIIKEKNMTVKVIRPKFGKEMQVLKLINKEWIKELVNKT